MKRNTTTNNYQTLRFPILFLLVCGLVAAISGNSPQTSVYEIQVPLPIGLVGDVYDVPDYLRKIEAQYAQNMRRTYFAPTWDQTSSFMIGKVAVGLVLPESTGNAYNWSQNEIDLVVAKAQASLDWWKSQADIHNIPLELTLDGPHIVSTTYEPIQMVLGSPDSTWCGENDLWINEVMANMGFNQFPDYVMNVRDYANTLRDTHNADWAFIIFIANADGPNINPPTDAGLFAQAQLSPSCPIPPPRLIGTAYRPGPMYITSDNPFDFTSNELEHILRHEQGHIFGASDEAHGAWPDCASFSACSEQFGYLDVENGNCDFSCTTNVECVMRAGADALCIHSRSHIGWRDTDFDGIPDPIDTLPDVIVNSFPSNPVNHFTLQYDAVAQDFPFSTNHPTYTNITINHVRVEYQLVNHTQGSTSNWLTATPSDGAWDSSYEEDFSILVCQNGNYTIRIRSVNEVGNISTTTVQHSLTVNLSQPCKMIYLPIIVNTDESQFSLQELQDTLDAYPAPVPQETLPQPTGSYP